MTFNIDWNRYKCIDLSWTVTANQTTPDRPFEVRPGKLGDGTNKFDIINTHTHVGTHVESPWHFYGKGKTCAEFPLEHFMGPAMLRSQFEALEDPADAFIVDISKPVGEIVREVKSAFVI